MNRDAIIGALRAHEAELRHAGITSLVLFGSSARAENKTGSDIDLLAAFDEARALSLLDIVHLENRLTDILGRQVDLIEASTLAPEVRSSAYRDALRAF